MSDRQTTSELIGGHTCVMMRGLNTSVESELEWLREFVRGTFVHIHYIPFCLTVCLDFHKRFLSLPPYEVQRFGSVTAHGVPETVIMNLIVMGMVKVQILINYFVELSPLKSLAFCYSAFRME